MPTASLLSLQPSSSEPWGSPQATICLRTCWTLCLNSLTWMETTAWATRNSLVWWQTECCEVWRWVWHLSVFVKDFLGGQFVVCAVFITCCLICIPAVVQTKGRNMVHTSSTATQRTTPTWHSVTQGHVKSFLCSLKRLFAYLCGLFSFTQNQQSALAMRLSRQHGRLLAKKKTWILLVSIL